MRYPGYLIYANANGGWRSPVEAAIMQGEGVTAGIPDLTIVTPDKVLWIEMKSENGKVTDIQDRMLRKIKELGHHVAVCYSFDDFERTCEIYVK